MTREIRVIFELDGDGLFQRMGRVRTVRLEHQYQQAVCGREARLLSVEITIRSGKEGHTVVPFCFIGV